MKKLRITSPYFNGNIDLVYDQNGKLCLIDAMNANTTHGQLKNFLSTAQTDIGAISLWFTGTSAKVIEVPLEATFEMFWNMYLKKINKARAIKLWDKLNDADRMSAILGISKYNSYLLRESWRTKADPETYLRNRYWENEY